MNKLLMAVVVSVTSAAPTMASAAARPLAGVLGNTGVTAGDVLRNLGPTVKGVLTGLPTTIAGTVLLTKNVVGTLPGLLTGAPINASNSSILVPLPGVKILEAKVTLPQILSVNAYVGGTPGVLITTKTGSSAN